MLACLLFASLSLLTYFSLASSQPERRNKASQKKNFEKKHNRLLAAAAATAAVAGHSTFHCKCVSLSLIPF